MYYIFVLYCSLNVLWYHYHIICSCDDQINHRIYLDIVNQRKLMNIHCYVFKYHVIFSKYVFFVIPIDVMSKLFTDKVIAHFINLNIMLQKYKSILFLACNILVIAIWKKKRNKRRFSVQKFFFRTDNISYLKLFLEIPISFWVAVDSVWLTRASRSVIKGTSSLKKKQLLVKTK